MAEDSLAERQVAVGKFKVVYPASHCGAPTPSNQHGSFATWESVSGLGSGEYGLIFRNGAIAGYSSLMVVLTFTCSAGTHSIGIETMDYAKQLLNRIFYYYRNRRPVIRI